MVPQHDGTQYIGQQIPKVAPQQGIQNILLKINFHICRGVCGQKRRELEAQFTVIAPNANSHAPVGVQCCVGIGWVDGIGCIIHIDGR